MNQKVFRFYFDEFKPTSNRSLVYWQSIAGGKVLIVTVTLITANLYLAAYQNQIALDPAHHNIQHFSIMVFCILI